MTEAKWLGDVGPRSMLNYLEVYHKAARTKAGRRKLRLFGCAHFRSAWGRLDEAGRQAVEQAERFADGLIGKKEFLAWVNGLPRGWYWGSAPGVAALVRLKPQEATSMAADWETGAARKFHCALVRDLFGNPFRPLSLRPFPAHVRALAQACDEAFPAVSDQFPILADALTDLGEEQAAAHCREALHVKGCHVVDWIMGKS